MKIIIGSASKFFVLSIVALLYFSCSGNEQDKTATHDDGVVEELEEAFLQAAMKKAEEIANGAAIETPLLRRAERYAERMKATLGLSDEQAKKLVALRLTFFTEAKSAKETFANDEKGLQKEMQELSKDAHKTLESLLTPEQLEVWRKQLSTNNSENDN